MEGSAARKGVRRAMTENDRARLREVYPHGAGLAPDALEQAGRSLVQLARELKRGTDLARELVADAALRSAAGDPVEVVAAGASAERTRPGGHGRGSRTR
jgi:hypothetical protein